MQIDRYVVKRLLGQGAMGKVYLAIDPKIDRQVAIKVLSTRNDDKDLRHRFRLEAKAIAKLKHPNIVELYDYSGENAADLFLVMEYVPGLSLYHLIGERGAMSEPTALCIGHELSLALEHAHKHQVVHRDLKPENILLHNGRVVLTDFGVVKVFARDNALGVSQVHTQTQVLGTPGFMAPEQFTGKGIDPRTDIFCLGAVLYNLTTARLPFEGESLDDIFKRLRKGRFVDPRTFSPLLSRPFCGLLSDCLRSNHKSRPKTATVIRERILEILELHGVSEVRQELVNYEKNPAGYAAEQRQRSIDIIIRDLKVALKDRDESQARALIGRMQVLTPVDERMRDISGVSFDRRRRPVFSAGVTKRHRWPWIVIGLLIGSVIGAAVVLALVHLGVIPPTWLQALEDLKSSSS